MVVLEEDPDDGRAHTEGSIPSKGSGIGSISLRSLLPQLKVNVPLALSTNDIFEIFSNVSRKESFQVIEMEQSIATAVNKEPFSIKRMFLRCIPFGVDKLEQPNESSISAVRL